MYEYTYMYVLVFMFKILFEVGLIRVITYQLVYKDN